MGKRIIRHFGHITFVVYLCLFVIIPATHCHAADLLPEDTTCETGHGPKHLPFFSVVQCCELHASNHTKSDEHHIHFLIDDQGFAARYNQTDIFFSPQFFAAIDEVHFNHYLHKGIGVVVSSADFYQEALRSYFSGLSPPLS